MDLLVTDSSLRTLKQSYPGRGYVPTGDKGQLFEVCIFLKRGAKFPDK